ncbi:2-octaprenyl-6-methoxyphenol hydroxylase [Oceaniovalibus guishaninsula JLT2003]|uniref:2-octaprenyl-6-methoxyphenol hydroxylase n=1 Tax=Oceaniovalibus guishaninsula JLT2003 TaxID=1231392 RepID=K2HN49_9RHOB|nr:2-octaprenyl-6-methoxyphenol hydroxylase [Oceaniovalibus guishaninsula JLT2003]
MDNPAHGPINTVMDTDIIIAGGGLNGAALALACVQGGLSVTLVDPAPSETRAAPDFDGRSYALSLGSRNLLSALGLWDDLKDDAQPILRIKVSDGHAGFGPSPMVLHFDHAEIEDGPMGHMVEDRHLRPALLAALDGAGVMHLAGRSVAAQTPGDHRVTVTLDDGTTIDAHVLVGCDGRASAVARRAGIARYGRDYRQCGLVAALGHERPHDGIAHQFFMPEGPLAILPLKGNRCSIVWTETAENARRIAALDDDAWLNILRPRFGDFLGDIHLAGGRFTYPLVLSVAQSFVAPRIALVGDAAHAVHPIAGQGLNAGLKDVATLAEVLTDARRRGEDFGRPEVLARYERWRRFDVTALALATDGFNRLFSNDNPLLRLGRDLGLGAVNALAPLRRGLLREAAGLTGDRPRLLRGLPLNGQTARR